MRIETVGEREGSETVSPQTEEGTGSFPDSPVALSRYRGGGSYMEVKRDENLLSDQKGKKLTSGESEPSLAPSSSRSNVPSSSSISRSCASGVSLRSSIISLTFL